MPFVIPSLGAAETLQLDFKAWVDATNRFEQAKDVAAMANAAGGCLLVGGIEKDRRLTALRPMTQGEAAILTRAYEEAVRDRCEPAPLTACEVVACDGGYVVAVHVTASLFPVAVRLRKEDVAARSSDGGDRWSGEAWVYFLRTVTQNQEVAPSRLALAMSSDIRRIVLLLRNIPPDAQISLRRNFIGGSASEIRVRSRFEVREDENFAAFHYEGDGTTVHVPLDHITSVYKSELGRWWVVTLPF